MDQGAAAKTMTRRSAGREQLRAVVGLVPVCAPRVLPQLLARALRTPLRQVSWFAVVALLAASATLCSPQGVAAQTTGEAHITVASTISAKAASEVALTIEVGPTHIVPPRSFVSLRGLPPGVSLKEGHTIAPGSWAIPLSALPALRARIPADISGRSEIVIRLIGMDGRLLAQATTTLIVEPAATPSPLPQAAPTKLAQPASALVAPQPSPPKAEPDAGNHAALRPELPAREQARAEHLLARGLDYLAAGNVAAARDFFERAAEIGLAPAALRLAATYDPFELPRLKVQGIVADRALARKWYERARDLGAPEAASQLARLAAGN